jgi:rfaE bifunctional protein nucleotidyltransferase chain/domain
MSAVDKVQTLDQLIRRLETARESGSSVALANGLFDILHVGHLRYLEAASKEADLLVVAINSDRSARELKGPTRPVTPEAQRAELIAGFACVEFVTIFDDNTVESVLRALRPQVHCKGTDYTAETVPEADVAREVGARVAIVGDAKTHSTRDIIRKLQS